MLFLDPSDTGKHTGPTFLQGGNPPPSFSLPLNAGVTVPALNTSSWPQSGRHVAAGLRKIQVFYRMIEF